MLVEMRRFITTELLPCGISFIKTLRGRRISFNAQTLNLTFNQSITQTISQTTNMSYGSWNSNLGGRVAYDRDRNEPRSNFGAFSRSSSQSQRQTTQGNSTQYVSPTRRSQQPSNQFQSQTGYSDPAFGSQSSEASLSNPMGSAGHGSETDNTRSKEVKSARRERRDYAERLLGPPRPPTQRPSPVDDIRAYEQLYGRQQPIPAPTVYYNDQFGQTVSTSGYAQVIPELEDFDTSSNTRRSHSSHSKGHGSQQKHKRPRH
ncbi:hypothetical protein CTA2_13082 [Colletotrichum tanaceti]|nr:hypothetical protein CTA2_13082 [Colletotrichum tanaceti]